jgi:hypothetical protein
MYDPEFLTRVEESSGRLRRIPYGDSEGIRGTVVLATIDAQTGTRRGFETQDVFGFVFAS